MPTRARPSFPHSQSFHDDTVEVNKFKGLDLIEYLENYRWRFIALYRRQ